MALAGVGTIYIVDKDTVNISNLNRQFLHTDKDIGTEKSESAKQTIKCLNPEINIKSICSEITKENVKDLVCDSDIIVDALDNNETRQIIYEFAISEKIPLVHGSVRGFNGEVTTYIPEKGKPCPFCIFDYSEDEENKENKMHEMHKINEEIPVLGAVTGIIGSIEALEVIKYITKTEELLNGKLLIWNGKKCSAEILEFEKDPDCKYCKD